MAESNGSLLPGLWRDSLHVTCGLTACTPGSAPGPTLGNEYGITLPLHVFFWGLRQHSYHLHVLHTRLPVVPEKGPKNGCVCVTIPYHTRQTG